MNYVVGSVPYVNALPLVSHLPKLGVEVIFDVPARLPELLDSGKCQAVMASSFEVLRSPNRCFASGVCIGSDGPAESVRLFSKVPFEQIRSLALDQSSLTSNHLALVLLAESYGVDLMSLDTEVLAPDLDMMLASKDACILIGDIGMTASGEGYHVMDLGEEWTNLTTLPFVWAVWVGTSDLDSSLVGELNKALDLGLANLPELIEEACKRSGWTESSASHYLGSTMKYWLDERALAGLLEYQRLLHKRGLLTDLVPLRPVALSSLV